MRLSAGGLVEITRAREAVTRTAGASRSVVPLPLSHVYGLVTTAGGEYTRVTGLEIDAFSRQRIDLTLKELLDEQDGVKHLL